MGAGPRDEEQSDDFVTDVENATEANQRGLSR
jgi:hypothetical protein